MEYLFMIIKVVGTIAAGVIAGHGVVYVFNRMPAEWLCDYGEEPSDELKDRTVQRIKGYPWKLVYTCFFVIGGINLVFYDWQFCAAAMVFCWALAIVAAADQKYGIIPDQFVILAAVAAMGFVPFYGSFMEPVYGALLGAGVMFVSAAAGKLIFKKETLGFGDVKLSGSIGLALGLKGTLVVLIISSLASAVVFAVKLIKKKIRKDDMVPLGPYICGAAIFYVVIICPLL